jgi:hypothetical protein
VAARAHGPPHPAALRPGAAQPDAAAGVRPGLAGHALGRRALRAARRYRVHPRVPPGLLPGVPRQHLPGAAPAGSRRRQRLHIPRFGGHCVPLTRPDAGQLRSLVLL